MILLLPLLSGIVILAIPVIIPAEGLQDGPEGLAEIDRAFEVLPACELRDLGNNELLAYACSPELPPAIHPPPKVRPK